jgi:hypothetical protein
LSANFVSLAKVKFAAAVRLMERRTALVMGGSLALSRGRR